MKLSNTINEVRLTWTRLHPYWKATNSSKKWQLIIYGAIVRSKLLYGLETLHLTEPMAKKLDAFQLRGLQQILGLNTTFINRANTNAKVHEEASRIAYPSTQDNRRVQRFSEFHSKRKAKLMGHNLRTDRDDPLRQIPFQPDSAYRVSYGKKRVGKPRQNWIHQTKKYVYETVLGHWAYNEENAQDDRVLNCARDRKFWVSSGAANIDKRRLATPTLPFLHSDRRIGGRYGARRKNNKALASK